MKRKLYTLLILFVLLTTLSACSTPSSQFIIQDASSVTEGGFTLTSPDLPNDGRLPIEYTCDGGGSTLALAWSGAPEGTASYAVIMHHVAAPDDIHWYWVLYDIPAEVTSLPKNVSGVGILGNNVNNGLVEYSPPCSKGPGDKEYIYTVYALSAQPQITVATEDVNRDVMLEAIKDITLASAELHTIYARQGMEDPQAQSSSDQQQGGGGGTPPAEAIAACSGQTENASCTFTDQNGSHTGVCKTQQQTLACAPDRDGQGGGQQGQGGNNQPTDGASAYNIEQAISDKAQGMTISYDALAFMTGDLGSDSFFPPGKVADFWGFQYLRDNDPSEMGHAGDFLTSAAMNTLNNLTADITHDLRNLLTVLSGYLESLRDGKLQPTPERFDVMQSEVQHLQRLVGDLRTLSLADAGELKLHRQPVAPVELLERVAQAYRHQAQEGRIDLCVEGKGTLPEVEMDAERMEQVLGNLVSNALRYTPEGGEIRLGANQAEGRLVLSVRDNGSGISPEILPHIFERSYRGDASRSGNESGLGLAIARSIVEAHGGRIEARSEGAGSEFIICL